MCWTRIQHQEYLQPGDDFSKLFSFLIFGCPGGTAKEKWRCSTVSTPSKRSFQGCLAETTPKHRSKSNLDTKKQGGHKFPGLTLPIASSHIKTFNWSEKAVAMLLSTSTTRRRCRRRRLGSWPPSRWRRLGGWPPAGPQRGTSWPSAGSPPVLPGPKLLLLLLLG